MNSTKHQVERAMFNLLKVTANRVLEVKISSIKEYIPFVFDFKKYNIDLSISQLRDKIKDDTFAIYIKIRQSDDLLIKFAFLLKYDEDHHVTYPTYYLNKDLLNRDVNDDIKMFIVDNINLIGKEILIDNIDLIHGV